MDKPIKITVRRSLLQPSSEELQDSKKLIRTRLAIRLSINTDLPLQCKARQKSRTFWSTFPICTSRFSDQRNIKTTLLDQPQSPSIPVFYISQWPTRCVREHLHPLATPLHPASEAAYLHIPILFERHLGMQMPPSYPVARSATE